MVIVSLRKLYSVFLYPFLFLLIIDQIPFFLLFFCYFAYCMKKYRIVVTEILSRIVETEAESEQDAVETVRQMYRNGDIILDASDYIETEISVKR